ncbi:MFS transporter [Nonomuraea sp. NPDC049624]|uniref:MFS transporter n=1 Tax=Nonomuraea sp. NPDC049624 TaxID=3154354 RepID=UPI00341FE15D
MLADTFPAGPRRNKALGVYGAMGGLGSVAGLLLGGALTEYLGWRWIMFVNLPIALLVLAGTFALVPGTRERGGLDLPGALTATLALGSLVYAINRAGSHGVGDGLTLAFGVVAVALLVALALVEAVLTANPAGERVPDELYERAREHYDEKALATLIMAIGQVGFFTPLALIGKPLAGVSPTEQWRR